MKKILILLLLFNVFFKTNGQQSTIAVQQYKIIVDVAVTCLDDVTYRYANTPVSSPTSPFGFLIGNSSAVPPIICPGTWYTNNGYPNYNCVYNIVECSASNSSGDCSLLNGDSLKIRYNNSSNVIKIKNFTNLNQFTGSTQYYSDTTYLYNSQFDISNIQVSLSNRVLDTDRPTYISGYGGNYSQGGFIQYSYNYPFKVDTKIFYPTGLFFDQTKQINAQCVIGSNAGNGFANQRYTTTTRVRVVLNTDPVLTLPSHDTVKVKQTDPEYFYDEGGNYNTYEPNWKYSLFPFTEWLPVPAALKFGNRQEGLNLSGYGLLGPDYINHLNETVKIKDSANSNDNYVIESAPANFILRLSSPHITAITPAHLNCFERNEGSLKIKFDRRLIQGERLNIFLFDTLNRVNYSALNLESLAADSSYTWPNELRAGYYFVSLIGKYAKGIPYDLYVNNRVDSIRVYKALNSINFEDGFNTTTALDTFDAETDFAAYSIATFTGAIKHFGYQLLTQPTKITGQVTVDSNVFCKGTAAGVITVRARGGLEFGNNKKYYKYSLKHQDSAQYTSFTNFTQTTYYPAYPNFSTDIIQKIRGIRAGSYLLHLRDSVDCFARDSLGNEVTYAFTITEPVKAITADYLDISPITSVDSANGHFNIRVTGGTPFATTGATASDEAYIAKLYDSTTTGLVLLQDNIHYTDTTSVDSIYNMKTPYNLHEGKYVLKLFDRSYIAVDPFNTGCFLELPLRFVKPDTLKVKINAVRKVTCFGERDGILKAVAKGGIRNDSTGYKFEWFRITAGQSVLLPGGDTAIHIYGDSLIAGLNTGTYRVQITDKYNNKKSDTFLLAQPVQMQLAFTTTPATCYSSFTGTMSVVVTGGTPHADTAHRYNYEWSNGALTSFVDSVAGGTYLLVVRDSVGCIARDTVSVTAPVRVVATETVQQVSCYNKRDGAISLAVTGGAPPYTYLWSNGATTSAITGLKDTTYWYKAMDSNGCFDTDTIILTKPDTILLNLGPDRKMCLGQILRLDGTIANYTAPFTYSWQSNHGFTANTAKVNITDSGRYILSVTEPSRNCILKDTINVSRIDSVINTDFLVATQAFKNDNVIVVNLSKPYPQDSIMWIIPQLGNTVQIINQTNLNAQLLFADTGRYPITMKVFYRSGCIDDTTKFINIVPKDDFGNIGNQANAYLKLYALVIPNPNPGSFQVQLTFSEPTTAKLRLINTLTNHVVDTRQVTIPSTNMFPVSYNFGTAITNGVYVMLIETPKGSFVAKVVIVH
jgi:SprB repeat